MERTRTFVIGTAMLVVVALLAFILYQRQQQKMAATNAPAADTTHESLAGTGPPDAMLEEGGQPPPPPESPRWDVEGVTLSGSDATLRQIVRELSGHPLLTRMLAIDGLAETFVAAVDNISEGATPAPHLVSLAPGGKFAPGTAGETLIFSQGNASRYDRLAGLALALSPEDCVELYRTFYPLLDQAYKELGYPQADFHRAVAGALRHLLQTPEPQGTPLLVRQVTTYAYADPQLEALSPVQKQLLRLGPENVRRIRQWLTEIEQLLAQASP